MAGLKLVISLVLLCMVVAPMTTQAITCSQVISALQPCLNYLKGTVPGGVPATCCNGVRTINGAAKTTADRRQACQCLKNTASGIPQIKPNLAEGLPKACNVNIPYKISYSTNCNNVQ